MSTVETPALSYMPAFVMGTKIANGLPDKEIAELLQERSVADANLDGTIDDIEGTVQFLTLALEIAFKRIAELQAQIDAK